MPLDTRYIPSKYFQEYMVDKDTGCPLAGGIVTSYKDKARIELKPFYKITGSPPNYTYTALPNPITLTAYGTVADNLNNDVIPYFFPYDASGNIELYYITVKSALGVAQFTREGEPNVSERDIEAEKVFNYIPNGQFLLHHNIVADPVIPTLAGEITTDVTDVAEGGWSFERTSGSAARDFVLFERIGSFVPIPSKSPRYAIQVKNEIPGGTDLFKWLAVTFRDVNKFASDTKFFTFSFQGKSNSGSTSDIEVKLIKNFGTGGDPQTVATLDTIVLQTTYGTYDIPFTFGENSETIGDLDDDFIKIVISFPVSYVFDDNFDNFILTDGDVQITGFPDTSNAEFIRDSLAGWPPVPNYENENLYLPIRLGLKGFEYDTGSIGDYVAKSTETLEKGELWCYGDKYRVDAYSDDLIPYRRLYEKWIVNSSIGLAVYGTGDDEMRFVREATIDQQFTTANINLPTGGDAWQSFTAGNNDRLVQVDIETIGGILPSAGTVTIYEGEGTSGKILSTNTGITLPVAPTWITVPLAQPFLQTSGQKYTIRLQSILPHNWRGNSAGGYPGGRYSGSPTEDALFKTYTDTDRADYKLLSNTGGAVTPAADGAVPTGFTFTPIQPDPYIVQITAVAASGMTVASYWTYHTTATQKFIIWYEIDGSGTQPVESADRYRKVEILSTDTAAVVANKTAIAINSYSMRVPDFRGYFLRIKDHGAGVDPDTVSRTDRGDGYTGGNLGTIQQDEFKSHVHTFEILATPTAVSSLPAGGTGAIAGTGTVFHTGGHETRAKNIYINWAVKY